MKNLSRKTLNEQADKILDQTYRIQNIIKTIQYALTYCIDNSQNFPHILDVFDYLNQELENLLSNSENLSDELFSIKNIVL